MASGGLRSLEVLSAFWLSFAITHLFFLIRLIGLKTYLLFLFFLHFHPSRNPMKFYHSQSLFCSGIPDPTLIKRNYELRLGGEPSSACGAWPSNHQTNQAENAWHVDFELLHCSLSPRFHRRKMISASRGNSVCSWRLPHSRKLLACLVPLSPSAFSSWEACGAEHRWLTRLF